MPGQGLSTYESGAWEIDFARRELRLRGKPVPLGGCAFDIVEVLIQSAGEIVTKDDLMSRVWPDLTVSDNTLQVHVWAVRKALGADRWMLQTTTGRGYRLLGDWWHQPESAAAVTVAPTRTQVPPSQTNLPAAGADLIGRDASLRQLRDLVSAYRIVTLIGPGGIGKTTLALQVARLAVGEFADGGWLIELASLSDPGLVPSTVAQVLRLTLGGEDPTAETVARAIGDRHLLLLLDNCEHLIDAVAILAEMLLRLCPRVTILTTSREVLRTQGEYVYRVLPLVVPAPGVNEANQILGHSAPECFIARAKELGSDFSSNATNLVTIAAICRHLDGIPLAIEFAAARAATLGIELVATGLQDRLALLTSGRRAALPRHRTLRATLDWSYDLLPATEAATLSTLAIFAGEFSLDAAIAVTGDVTAQQVLDIISNLVTKSLVVADIQSGIPHFRLLETIRLYALEKLRSSGGASRAARCHAVYYCGLAEQAEFESRTRTEADWLAVYGWNLDNWRAALDWAFSADGDADIGMALTAGALPVWFKLSLRDECRRRIEQALSFTRADTDPNVTMRLNAGLGAVLFYTKWGATPAVADAWESVLLIADHLDDNEHRLWARWGLWNYQMNHCEFSKALVSARHFKGLAIDPTDVAAGNRMLGVTLHYLGSHAQARDHLESVLALRVDTVARSIVRNQYDLKLAARCYLPRILWLQGFPDQAMRAAESAFRDASAAGHTLSLSLALVHAACPVSLWTGDLEAADGFVATLMDHSTTHGPGFWHAEARCFDGILRVMRGDVAAGLQMFRPAMQELADHNEGMNITGYIAAMAAALATSDEIANGALLVDEGLLRAERDEDHWSMPELLRLRGEFLLREDGPGAATSAEALYRRSLDLAARQGSLAWALRAAISLANLLLGQNRFAEAISVITPVHGMFTEGFKTTDLRRANRTLGALGIGPLEP